jgi:hypothetical protein
MGTVQKGIAGVARVRASAGIVLGVVLGISGVVAWPPDVAVADSSSDIPGVPLSPGVVVGPLGGSIYDAVYSLDVAPGTVILASLTGTSGTDFDIYLFDGSATTVVTNQGVIAKSTGPTSTESLSYAAPVGGRFYVDLNSATAVVGTYTLVVQVIPDRPAVVRLALGAGRARTNDTTVSVAVSASGSLSDAARMAFSADGITWQPWIAYQPATSWTFPGGDGTKTLWAKVENAAGVASGPVSASILLDTERPGVTAVDPAINDDLVGTRPTITVTFSEPIDPESWTQLGLVVQTSDGVLVPGVFNVTAPTAGTFRPSDDLVAGGVYVLTVGAVRDVAGNLVAPSGSWVATDRPAPDLAVAASPRVVDRGATSLLSGRLTAPTGVASLTLEARPVGTIQAVALGSVPVAADGSFSARVTPSSTTEYLLHVPAAGGFGAGSVSAVVYVRRAVRLNWSSSTVHAGRVGARVSIVASVAPAAPGVGVAFRLERWSAVSRSWRLVGTLNRHTDAAGRASVTWTPSGSGLYRWRATAASTPDYSTGAGAWVRWSIGR